MISPFPCLAPSAVCIIRGADGRFVVGSSEAQGEPAVPAWMSASASASADSMAEAAGGREEGQQEREGFRLLYAGTADKAMMIELEADQV